VNILLKDGRTDVNQGDHNGRTLLRIACEGGNGEMVKFHIVSGKRMDLSKKLIGEEDEE